MIRAWASGGDSGEFSGDALNQVPAWDREGNLAQARSQTKARVDQHLSAGTDSVWLSGDASPQVAIDRIAGLGPKQVVGSDTVLWSWSPLELQRLSAALAQNDGTLVFVEPTAGLGLRRAAQLLGGPVFRLVKGHDYRSDIPARLRATGLIVTTQVRLRHGFPGDYVRGEARHFSGPSVGEPGSR